MVFPLGRFILQYDNVPCHLSTSTLSDLTERHIDVLDWPANYPDANQIENLWHFIKIKINDLGPMNPIKCGRKFKIYGIIYRLFYIVDLSTPYHKEYPL